MIVGMLDYTLSPDQLANLRQAHRRTRDKREKAKHLVELDVHLQANRYLSAKAVAYWVKETFGVSYTESGMTAVLHRLGYVYKKPRLVPGKADREA